MSEKTRKVRKRLLAMAYGIPGKTAYLGRGMAVLRMAIQPVCVDKVVLSCLPAR